MKVEINKVVGPFDEGMNVTRDNPDRKKFGEKNADGMSLASEFAVTQPVTETPAPVVETKPPVTEGVKFTHKLKDGTLLEAPTVEALAAAIEASLHQAPTTPVEFEDKPLYQPYEFKPKELSLTEQADILNIWKENPQKAMRMLQEADLGAPASVIIQKLNEAQTAMRTRAEEEAGALFVMEQEDYNPTRANGQKLTAYLREKGKPVTKQNLVLSFQQLVAAGDKTLLRKPEEQTTESGKATETSLTEAPPPPTIVPVGTGRVETKAPGAVDVAKFANMTLAQQKAYFADLRRQA
jgi:hypothetical protein